MKLFLATRGSQGDVYPYLGLADALVKAGHDITISIPKEFEKHAKSLGLNFMLQNEDDITALVEGVPNFKRFLVWMQYCIEQQFKEYTDVVKNCDLIITANTEFAAVHIAEYCRKPIIRTAFAPLLPTPKIFPPLLPFVKPPYILRPRFMWGLINIGLDKMVVKPINKIRAEYGMPPFKSQAVYAPNNSDNFMMYSPTLAEVDPNWKYRWHANGYCFNDILPYDKDALKLLEQFVKKDSRPTVFFSLGSCTHKKRFTIADWILDICAKHNYKLVVGAGWFKPAEYLGKAVDLFKLETYLPHNVIMPFFNAIIHHGGAGTTHSAARSGIPQLILPIILDQFYFAGRTMKLGVSPGSPKHLKNLKRQFFEKKVVAMIEDPLYEKNAKSLAEKINAEEGLEGMFKYIESVAAKYKSGGYQE
ncbi:MAG: glycosyltransferase [Termitinemataceae bacterium]|nr:MAG: glycosyltransferase [Termitinemataceae bacterium]